MSTTFSKKFSQNNGVDHPHCFHPEIIQTLLVEEVNGFLDSCILIQHSPVLPSKLRQRSEILWKGRSCAFSLIMKQVYVLHRKYLYGHIFPQLLSSEIHSHFGKRPYIIQTWQGCFKSQISSLLWFTAQPYKRAGTTDVWGKVRKQACFMLYCYQKQLTMKPQPL